MSCHFGSIRLNGVRVYLHINAFSSMVEPSEKRARTETSVGTMPSDLKGQIENALAAIGEMEYHKRSHKKGSGPVQPKVLPEEDLVHDKAETIRKGGAGRVHYKCSNAKCEQLIRADKWETHAIAARSDRHLQEPAEDVLERSMNFAPEAWARIIHHVM